MRNSNISGMGRRRDKDTDKEMIRERGEPRGFAWKYAEEEVSRKREWSIVLNAKKSKKTMRSSHQI